MCSCFNFDAEHTHTRGTAKALHGVQNTPNTAHFAQLNHVDAPQQRGFRICGVSSAVAVWGAAGFFHLIHNNADRNKGNRN